jgi:hypothetical protein
VGSRIVITPAPMEIGIYGAEWQAVCDEVDAAGLEATLERPIERRDTVHVILETSIAVTATKSLDVVIEILRKRLRRRDRHRPSVIVYGPGGEVLTRIELPKLDSEKPGDSS